MIFLLLLFEFMKITKAILIASIMDFIVYLLYIFYLYCI